MYVQWPRANVHLAVSPSSQGGAFGDEPGLFIEWSNERNYVYAEWKRFATSIEFRASTMRILESIRERKASALVSDNRRLEGAAQSSGQWTSAPGAICPPGTATVELFARGTDNALWAGSAPGS